MLKNGVHDACDGGRGIDHGGTCGQPLSRRVLPPRKGFPLLCRAAPRGGGASGKPLLHVVDKQTGY